jgi:hypothetical protein
MDPGTNHSTCPFNSPVFLSKEVNVNRIGQELVPSLPPPGNTSADDNSFAKEPSNLTSFVFGMDSLRGTVSVLGKSWRLGGSGAFFPPFATPESLWEIPFEAGPVCGPRIAWTHRIAARAAIVMMNTILVVETWRLGGIIDGTVVLLTSIS